MRLQRYAMAGLLMSPALCPAAEDAPAWVREAAALAAPKYDGKVPAVILLNEQHVVADDNGRRTCTTRRVVRVLSREGREFARASEVYLNGTGKIRQLRG